MLSFTSNVNLLSTVLFKNFVRILFVFMHVDTSHNQGRINYFWQRNKLTEMRFGSPIHINRIMKEKYYDHSGARKFPQSGYINYWYDKQNLKNQTGK